MRSALRLIETFEGLPLTRVASLQPAATAIVEKLLLSSWQRGEMHFNPLGRHAG
jgi:hypothetical protein